MTTIRPFIMLLALTLTPLMATYAQTTTAEKILERVEQKYEAYKTMKIEFVQVIQQAGSTDKQEIPGVVYIEGDKFRLEYAGQNIISDGNTYWVHMEDDNEVNISAHEADDDEMIKPSDIFKLYQKDFKYILDGTARNKAGEMFHIIRFSPRDISLPYHTIKLYVNQKDYSIYQATVIDKEQNMLTFKIKNLQSNMTLPDDTFKFDPSKFPGITVTDSRS